MTTTTLGLFNATIRRTYTPAYRDRWHLPDHQDTSHPEFAESAEEVVAKWEAIQANQSPYWLEKFRDELLMVEPLDLAERRAAAARFDARCCPLAVVRPCVCSVSFLCPEHGVTCVGTHD